jgi:hypothetical protein
MKMIYGENAGDLEIMCALNFVPDIFFILCINNSLEEKGVITGCKFAVYESENMLDFDFNQAPLKAKLIMKVRSAKIQKYLPTIFIV